MRERRRLDTWPLDGEYEPSTSKQVARQVATRSSAPTAPEANTLRGMPIVVVTSTRRAAGKLRKVPVMRVEHEGEYAIVASMGGAPGTRSGTTTCWPTRSRAAGRRRRHEMVVREVEGDEHALWWERAVAV